MDNLPDINMDSLNLYVIDDQTTEFAMFAALKLGDMIRDAIRNYEALAKQEAADKSAEAGNE